jgi:hypothetical protein
LSQFAVVTKSEEMKGGKAKNALSWFSVQIQGIPYNIIDESILMDHFIQQYGEKSVAGV